MMFNNLEPPGCGLVSRQRTRLQQRTVLSLLVIAVLLGQSAFAATQLIASDPQPGTVVSRHNISFSLRFNRRIENAQCSVSLQMPTGEYRNLQLQAQTASDQIKVSDTALRSGSYVLNWQIETPLEPVTRGTVRFSVR